MRVSYKKNVIICVVILAFPLYVLNLILNHYVNIPYWDEWDLFQFIKSYNEQTLNIGTFFEQHMEHRIVLTKIVFLLTHIYFDENRLVILIFQFIVVLLLLFFLLWKLKYVFPHNSVSFIALGILFSGLLFSPAASNIWFWGFLIQHTLAITFFVIAVFCFHNKQITSKNIIIAIIAGILASFSSANGLIVWPVLVSISLINKHSIIYKLVLILSSITIIGIYFYGYQSPALDSVPDVSLVDKAIYTMVFIGSIFGINRTEIAFCIGLVGCVLMLSLLFVGYKIKTVDWSKILPWIWITAYPLASALLGGQSRAKLGLSQALDSRYVFISSFFWIGLFVILMYIYLKLRDLEKNVLLQRGVTLFFIIIVLLYSTTQGKWLNYYISLQSQLLYASETMKSGVYNSTIWKNLYPNSERVLMIAEYYKLNKLYPFSKEYNDILGKNIMELNYVISDNAAEGSFELLSSAPLDTVSGKTDLFKSAIEAKGWVYSRKEIDRIIIVDDTGTIQGMGFYGKFRRLDVANYLKSYNNDAEYSGWQGFVLDGNIKSKVLTAYVKYKDTLNIDPLRDPKIYK